MLWIKSLDAAFVIPQKVASTSIKKAIRDKIGVPDTRWKSWEKENQIDYESLQDQFVTAFVRNPFDRLVSCYHNQCLDADRYGLGDCRFIEFVMYVVNCPAFNADKHFRPLSKDIEYADFVAHYEHLDKDWGHLRKRFGFGELPLENKTLGRSHWSKYYDRESLDLVYDYYKEDFERFGY